MKSGKHQRSKQRCQDLCWKVHDRARPMHELRNQNISIVSSIVFCARSRPRKRKHTTKNFVKFHNHSPLLTVLRVTLTVMMSMMASACEVWQWFFNTNMTCFCGINLGKDPPFVCQKLIRIVISWRKARLYSVLDVINPEKLTKTIKEESKSRIPTDTRCRQ